MEEKKTQNEDLFEIGGKKLRSRLFTGTGKYASDSIIPDVCEASGSEVITVALRRVDFEAQTGNVMDYVPKSMQLLPNTSGARNHEDAVRIARLAQASGCGDWIKIEVISDNKYLTLSPKVLGITLYIESINSLINLYKSSPSINEVRG